MSYMKPLLDDIRGSKLLWLLVFVPVVFAAARLKPGSHTLLFVLSVYLIFAMTLFLLPPQVS